MGRLFVYDDHQTEEFGKKYFSKIIPREEFLKLKDLDGAVPIICNMDNAWHGQDIENIEKIVGLKCIDKKELSIVVFDVHTDMYPLPDAYANWVRQMLNIGYDDISIVGVVEFASTDTLGRAYDDVGGRVEFFIGPEFDHKKHFKGYNPRLTTLRPLNEFYEKQLRQNTVISLDCDVSQGFSEMKSNDEWGWKGETKVKDLFEMIKSIKVKSHVVGQTVYGTLDSFNSRRANVYKAIV